MFPTYSISKIASETVCRFVARQHGIPTTIARLSVPYGDNGGWMYFHMLMMQQGLPIDIHPEGPNLYNPIHVDDYIEKNSLPAGRRDAGGHHHQFRRFRAGEHRTVVRPHQRPDGTDPEFNKTTNAFGSLCIDTTRMHELIGRTRVDWRDGIRRQLQALAPEVLK